MRLSLRLPVLALVALLAACARGEAPPGRIVESVNPINYYVRVTAPGSDRYQITLAADHLRRDSVDFVLPAWIPGQYATRVPSVAENFAARDGGGNPIPVRRLAVNVWRIYTETTDYVTVDYHIRPGTPVEPLASRIQLDLHGGYAMGGAILGFLDGIVGRPVTVTFDLPPSWRATSPMRPAGPNRFAAISYHEVPGSLFVMGDRWAEYKLFVEGKPHQIVVQGAPPDFPPDTLLRLVNETIDHATLFFGQPPYERYIFAIHFVSPEESGMGASGQAAGSALFLPPLAGNRMREAGLGSLLLHQYLHAWYPGQFAPVSLMRPEYRFPPRVPDAWLIEGAAEYYARLLPVRHGTMDRQEFYDALADVLWYWRELGGGNRIDLLDLDTAGRSGDAREASRLVAGGTLAVFLLDLMIREETGGLQGVDQILHFLQRRSGTTGYLEDQVWTEAAAVLGLSPAALDLLATQGSIPIEANLARAGLRQVQRDLRRRSLGAVLAPDAAGRFVVNAVERGGTAASAGMREGDRLVKINDTPVAPDEVIATRFALMTYIEEAETGSAVTFEVVRRGQPVELRGTVRALPGTRIAIVEAADATPTALQVRNSLFRSSSYATD